MAKSGKKTATPAASGGDDRLEEAIRVFASGDYQRARALLQRIESDVERSEGAREDARELIAATRIERGTLQVGLACLGLLILVLVATAVTQP